MSSSLPPACQAILLAAVQEFQVLSNAVDVEASDDKPDVEPDALLAHLATAADQLSHEATKLTAIFLVTSVTEEHCRFVCEAITQPLAMLVSGVQLFCRHAGTARRAEARSLVRCVFRIKMYL